MSEQFFWCSLLIFSEKKLLGSFVSLCQVLRCWKVSSGPTFLVRGFQDLCVRMLFYCLQDVVILFWSKKFHGFVSQFQEFRYQWVFSGPVFLFVRGFQGFIQMVVLLYLGVVLQFFIKGVAWIFWLTFSGVQVSEFVCQGFIFRGFQTVNLFVKAVEVFIGSVYCQRFSTVNLLKMLKCFFRPMHEFCLSEDFMV